MQNDERLSGKFRAELSQLLNLADMVKFAGFLPSNVGVDEVIDQSICLVQNTSEPSSDMTSGETSNSEDQ